MNQDVALVAGEASGDLVAGRILSGLRARLPDGRFYGIGGQHMIEQGFQSIQPLEKMTVRGLFEVIPRYRELKRIHTEIGDELLARRPGVFVAVDYPGFNLALEERLRQNGIPTVHFVGPQIWAWRGWRIKKIRRAVSHMLLLFPFEEAIYREAGVPATFVGHPLAEALPLQPDTVGARQSLGLREDAPVLAILPGSRTSEIKYHTQPFLGAARILLKRTPELQLVVPMVGPSQLRLFEQLRCEAGLQDIPLKVIEGHSVETMTASDAVLVASGTASLEVALCKKPMVIAYKLLWATAFLIRHMAYIPSMGLPNILANETLVPELKQGEVTPEALAEAVWHQLTDDANRNRLEQRFMTMHHELRRDTVQLASDVIVAVMKEGVL